MKKILLIAGLLTSIINAADNDLYNNSVAGYVGYGINNGGVYGIQINRNLAGSDGMFSVDTVQFAMEYASLNSAKRDKAVRLGANAIWYIENISDWTPYLKGGLGAQWIGGTDDNISAGDYFYGTVGVGTEYLLRGDTAAFGELVDHITFAGNHNVKLTVGLKYSFGQEF